MSTLTAPKKVLPKVQKARIFTLQSARAARVESIECICEIEDPRKDAEGNKRTGNTIIRYVRGEQSIFADEQRQPRDKERGVRVERMFFNFGACVVQPAERGLLKFIEMYTGFRDDKNENYDPNTASQFIELNPTKDAAKAIEEDKIKTKVKNLIYTLAETKAGEKELKTYAEVIGVDINRALSDIVFDLVQFGERSPQMFWDGLNSTLTANKWWVLKAIKLKYISVNETARTINGASNAVLFTAEPSTLVSEIVDEFVKWTDGKEGSVVFANLKKFVEERMKEEK